MVSRGGSLSARTIAAVAAALFAAGALPGVAAAQTARAPLDIRLFARVGNPGQPEAIAVADDGAVYVGTNQQQRGDARAPSKVFAYASTGRLLREYVIAGQDLGEDHGIQGLAFDGDGLLYVLDRAATPRVILLDPVTGAQRDFARFRDVPSCTAAGRSTDCSQTVGDMESGPNTSAFAADGSLYVTDIDQALIWRVPPGGGRPEVFFTDPRLENLFGPNGIAVMADRRTLLLAVTAQGPAAGNPTEGRLFTLPIRADGRPGSLGDFYRSRPFDGPDGFAIARSGRVYLALAGASQIALISAAGQELARAPTDPIANQRLDPPVDGPASVAFLGDSVLVTNQSFPAGNPAHWAVLDVFAGESGLPLLRPRIAGAPASLPPAGGPRLRLVLTYRRGGRGCALGPVRASVAGSDRGNVAEARFFVPGGVIRDRTAPFTAIVARPRVGPARRHTVRVRVTLRDGRATTLRAGFRTCARRAARRPRFTG